MEQYIIYGAAAVGKIVKVSLEKCNLPVCGYIDKRAFEIKEYNGLPVWSLDEIATKSINEKTVIFIGIKNVFEHEKIAEQLRKKGFQWIIYKPYNVILGQGTKEETELAKIYDLLYEGKVDGGIFKIPQIGVSSETELFDYGIVNKNETEVTAYIPTEFIFTYKNTEGKAKKWQDINILSFFTHIEFFKSLDNQQNCSVMPYLTEYCEYAARLQSDMVITDSWKENVIRNRTQIFEQMTNALNLDHSFFVRNAPVGEWDKERRIFYLKGGKHRSTFLVAKGFYYIPLKINARDYEDFLNREASLKLNEILVDYDGEIKIPHPYFYRHFKNRDTNDNVFQAWFSHYYGKVMYYRKGIVDFSGFRVVDISGDFGNLARFMTKLGMTVCRLINSEELELQMNRLFGTQLVYGMKENEFDLLILDKNTSYDENEYVEGCKEIILRNATFEEAQDFCEKNKLSIVLKINTWNEGLVEKNNYLLTHIEKES